MQDPEKESRQNRALGVEKLVDVDAVGLRVEDDVGAAVESREDGPESRNEVRFDETVAEMKRDETKD